MLWIYFSLINDNSSMTGIITKQLFEGKATNTCEKWDLKQHIFSSLIIFFVFNNNFFDSQKNVNNLIYIYI